MHISTNYVYKYNVDMYLLCIIRLGLGAVLVVCGECYNLGKIVNSVIVFPPYRTYIIISSNELTRPVMGTIVLIGKRDAIYSCLWNLEIYYIYILCF